MCAPKLAPDTGFYLAEYEALDQQAKGIELG